MNHRDTGTLPTFSKEELLLLNNALNEILNGPGAIAAWEFQLRTGVERQRAEVLLERFRMLLDLGADA
jgi:hypothetical protein